MNILKRTFYCFTLVIAFGLSGCKTTEPLYYYGDYQSTVYSYFKADDASISEQINSLEQTLSKANGRPVPPGFHAHLGMLYFEAGNSDLAQTHLLREKELFPESAAYIDFLLTNRAGV